MLKRYQRWINRWEDRLSSLDTNRVVRPLDWGVGWTRHWPGVNGNFPGDDPAAAEAFFHELNRDALADSDRFFAYDTPRDFRLERRLPELHPTGNGQPIARARRAREADFLRFTSPVRTPHAENNLVNARWFPARGRRAVVILPQWNSDAESHNGLGRIFNLLGIASLRLTMPDHDVRKPAETERADYAVSANVGRTLDAARQAVLDIRCCLDWLESQGYSQLGIVGTSLGSCYAFLASAHDPRLRVNVFNHASTYFADVVWNGQTTRHIRAAVESAVGLDSLRRAWLAISPMSYFDQFQRFPKKSVIVYATCDLTFRPEYTHQIISEFRRRRLPLEVSALPCGHYTIGQAPFKYLDALYMARFLESAL
ncbi:MAG: RcgR family putative quorum lactone hydrolase [Terriglobales bacterium]